MNGDPKTDGISERLYALIAALGITQKEFAEKLGVSPAFINDVLKRGKSFSQETIVKLAFKFHVNINWFLTGTGSMFLPPPDEADKQTDEIRFVIRKLRERDGMFKFVQTIIKTTDSEWKKIQEMVRVLLGDD
ncbi:helix-turn-helix domain-containing protein [Leptospira alstonii]|uniref:Bacteriophage CI repressor protein n=2 Tax=Leptospira alstonii TaxID=28452 RepID=M6CS54_9LEPT|nr:helix-turn-helix transcriptional regulator [Leptospira alstonii]EMJ94787.1 bacteriophage CI repressor protein [Leptospira alstonii serovar Sichuan str. 79601]EQA80923.1 bacteriophage CI repressor protein [Leptospira alstonii serovar Pingchang str. 80-412]